MSNKTPTQHKSFSTNCRISADETRTVVACISSNSVDRSGDVLIPQGMNSKDFEQNALVMLNHNYYTLPVGKVMALKRGEDMVEAKIKFAERPTDHPEDQEWVPDTLFSLYQQGVMNAFSVGFIPTDSRPANGSDLRKFGEDCRQVINRWKLLELSCVPLPCNQDAVATAVSKGFVTQEVADKLFTKSEDDKPDMGTCSECGKEYPLADMTVDDDEYTCSECAGKTYSDDEGGEDEDPGEKSAPEPEVKEIVREIAPAKRVAAIVEVNRPQVEVVKHVHRFIEPVAPDVTAKTYKAVVRTLDKARGKVWAE